jgi:DNA-directed RNA polymerase specialized sigma24 family protein
MNRPEFPFARQPAGNAVDAELSEALRACARHSVAGLRRLHDLIAPRLLAELLQMLGDRKMAEAALVDCFVAIWNEAVNFNPQRNQPRTWLLSIARHHAMDLMRGRSVGTADEVDSLLCFLHAVLHEEGAPQEQRLLQLVWRSGRSPAELARALKLPLRRVQQEIRSSLDALSRIPS